MKEIKTLGYKIDEIKAQISEKNMKILNLKKDKEGYIIELKEKYRLPIIEKRIVQPPIITLPISEDTKIYQESQLVRNLEAYDKWNRLSVRLQIIFQVYVLVIDGHNRSEATKDIAELRGIEVSSVYDKYTRQLDKTANDIDILMLPENKDTFKGLLIEKNSDFENEIDDIFNIIWNGHS